MDKSLLIGIGNYSRSDDALGWRFADAMKEYDDILKIEYRYQLQIEDADLISHFEMVYFVDASHEKYPEGFQISSCDPDFNCSFTSHALTPQTILQLVDELYGVKPKAYVIGICGYHWELQEGMSHQATANLKNALLAFGKKLEIQPLGIG